MGCRLVVPPASIGTDDAFVWIMNRLEVMHWNGVGQSGYTAGRREHDGALERDLQTRNQVYPRGTDENEATEEGGTDDRWTGRGGPIPREADSQHGPNDDSGDRP